MVQRLAEKMHKLDFDDEVTGLIYGHAFRSGEPPARLNSQQVCQAYQALPPGDGFIWLHLNLNHAAAEKWLKNHFAISDFSFTRFATAPTPRASSAGRRSVRRAQRRDFPPREQ